MPSEYDAFRSLTDALSVDPLEQTTSMTIADRRRRQAEARELSAVRAVVEYENEGND